MAHKSLRKTFLGVKLANGPLKRYTSQRGEKEGMIDSNFSEEKKELEEKLGA